MSYRKIDFLNDIETKLLYLLKENLNEKYAILTKVRLSEFLYSTQHEGSDAFYDEFQAVNLITIPFGIYDTTNRKLSAVVYFSSQKPEGKALLESHDVACIGIASFRDVLTSDALSIYTGRDLTAFVWLLWIKNTQIKDKK